MVPNAQPRLLTLLFDNLLIEVFTFFEIATPPLRKHAYGFLMTFTLFFQVYKYHITNHYHDMRTETKTEKQTNKQTTKLIHTTEHIIQG